jgi:hypothetical protein
MGHKGVIPARKIGRAWGFSRPAPIEHLAKGDER